MDATTPFRRWLCAGTIALAFGCQSANPTATARPQMPSDPLPGPIAPTAPPATATPTTPLPAPIAGLPLSPTAPIAPAVQTGFSIPVEKPASIKSSILPEGDPRIKVVALVGAGNIVTD